MKRRIIVAMLILAITRLAFGDDCSTVAKQLQDKASSLQTEVNKELDMINKQILAATQAANDQIKKIQADADQAIAAAKKSFDDQVNVIRQKSVSDIENVVKTKMAAVNQASVMAQAQKDFQDKMKTVMDQYLTLSKQMDNRYEGLLKQANDAIQQLADPISTFVGQLLQSTSLTEPAVQQKITAVQTAISAANKIVTDLSQKMDTTQQEMAKQIAALGK